MGRYGRKNEKETDRGNERETDHAGGSQDMEPVAVVQDTDQVVVIDDDEGPEDRAPTQTFKDKSLQTNLTENSSTGTQTDASLTPTKQSSTSSQTDAMITLAKTFKDVSVQTEPTANTCPPANNNLVVEGIGENCVNELDEVIAILDQLLLMYP